MTSWVKNNIDCDNGTVGGLPVVTWTRAVEQSTVPPELQGVDTAKVCGYPVTATSFSSTAINAVLACQPRLPISGKCSNGGTYSSATGCVVPPANNIGVVCKSVEDPNPTSTLGGNRVNGIVGINGGVNGCKVDRIDDWIFPGTPARWRWENIGTRNAVVGGVSYNVGGFNDNLVADWSCPTNTVKDPNTIGRCIGVPSRIDDLQCPTLFQSKNFSTNRCESSSATGSGQPGASDSRPTMVALGTLAPDAELGF
jgi:hypothetical protein